MKKIGYKNNTLYFWWREKNQEALMCFFLCLEERKKVSEIIQVERKNPENSSPDLMGAWGNL